MKGRNIPKGDFLLHQMLSYFKGYAKESILAPLFKMLEAFFDLLVPFVMASIINIGISNQDTDFILRRCAVLVLLGIVGLVSSITAQYFASKAAVGYATALRHSLFHHIQTLGFSEMDRLGTNTLITRMTSDINQVQSGLNLFLRLFLRSPFIVFSSLVMAFRINRDAAMIFVVAIPLLAVAVFGIMLVTIPLYKKVQEQLDQVLGITRENLTGVRVIRAFTKEQSEVNRFETANSILTALQKKVGRISGFMNPITYVIINLAILAVLHTGAVHVGIGDLRQGDVIALVSYMGQILIELIKLADLIIQMTKAAACAGRVSSVLHTKPGMEFAVAGKSGHMERKAKDTAHPANAANQKNSAADASDQKSIPTDKERWNNAVRFEQVSLTYPLAAGKSLKDISFCAKSGQTIGIIGGTGSGKSSLVHLIPRFYDATSGDVLLFGRSVRNYSKEELRRLTGIALQKSILFQGTIRSNLLWGKENATEEELWQALHVAQAEEFVREKSKGLDEPVEQGGRNLSGGQKQRLTIARALVKNPKILILDDSTSALDYTTDAALRRALRNLPVEMTTFIVSQRASSVRYADQILVLEDGSLAGIGTHEKLLRSCRVYQEIYESQYKKGGKQECR